MAANRAKKATTLSWKKHLFTAIAIVLVGSALILFHFTKSLFSFPIHQVKVTGTRFIEQAEIKQTLIPFITNGFFSVRVENIKEQLLQLPWISSATVRRVWPDQIIVDIAEKQPLARWNGASILSATGELFHPAAKTVPAGLPLFFGPEGEQMQIMGYYDRLSQILQPLHVKITRLELVPHFAWRIVLDNGIKLTAGYKDSLTQLTGFVKVYPKIVGARADEVEYIDLRYPNGMAVRWKIIS